MGTSMTIIALLVAAFLASVVGTRVVYHFALRAQLLDIPNDRSSHTNPTPRGGGVAVAVVLFVGVGILWIAKWIPTTFALALAAGIPIAVIGFLDDRRPLPPRFRIAIHAGAAVWVVAVLGGFPTLDLGILVASFGILGAILAVVAVVWMSNLYNFMDGIDGLVATVAVVVGSVGGGILAHAGAVGLASVAWVVAAAAAGFLVWNWSPAAIFMGDVGSVLLGFTFAILALAGERAGAMPALAWAILLAPFLVDATVTTARRALCGERWYEAHRTFAYQRAVQAGYSHRTVTSAVIILELVMAALAIIAIAHPRSLTHMVVLAFGVSGVVWGQCQRMRSRASTASPTH